MLRRFSAGGVAETTIHAGRSTADRLPTRGNGRRRDRVERAAVFGVD